MSSILRVKRCMYIAEEEALVMDTRIYFRADILFLTLFEIKRDSWTAVLWRYNSSSVTAHVRQKGGRAVSSVFFLCLHENSSFSSVKVALCWKIGHPHQVAPNS